jgi:N-acyl amino acid synthase of PEP-CTERM/exosortase system
MMRLRELYESYFHIHHLVDGDPRLLQESYRLRYQVYCSEHGYEDPGEFPDQQERDHFDDRAFHSLLIHRPTGIAAGCTRLIRVDPNDPHSSLPVDGLCRDPALHDEGLLPRSSLAEVSRFAVSKDFRKRIQDARTPTGVGEDWREVKDERRRIPHISLGLIQAIVCSSYQHGITHWVAEMEPALLRMLRSFGVHFVNLGPVVEFHGRRQPCYVELAEMLRRARRERPEVWELISADGSCG